jgi:hypothetical protein
MPRAKRLVEAGLLNKGFQSRDSHHKFFVYHTTQGMKTAVRTRTSQGGSELDDFLLGQMAKQCKLSKSDFLRLVDCPMTQPEYQELLVTLGEVAAG